MICGGLAGGAFAGAWMLYEQPGDVIVVEPPPENVEPDLPKIGEVIRVRIDNVPDGTCGPVQLTKSIEHLALTVKMVRKSAIDLVEENADLPDSYFDAYRKWGQQKKHDVLKVTIQEAILSTEGLTAPMICNFLPSQA